ncbi:hypothetical protein N9X41_04980 [Porticoccaceae bacterium]|jgi:hypothetical protein|nr:hypothetical protein [Porticoccaceae bacterium]
MMPGIRVGIRALGWTLACVLMLFVALLTVLWPQNNYLSPEALPFTAQRLAHRPIITVDNSPRLQQLAEAEGYININGPSMILVPDWVENPLGKYYLYFSHHKGGFIRMAYGDMPEGPWTVYEAGVLSLEGSGFPVNSVPQLTPEAGFAELWQNFSIYIVRDAVLAIYKALVTDQQTRQERGIALSQDKTPHIASPELVVDHDNQRILMFYHGQRDTLSQITGIASSGDGISFTNTGKTVAGVYMRHFEYRNKQYLLGSPGILFRSDSLLGPYQPRDRSLFEPNIRHAALLLEEDSLMVAWSRVGEAPEKILLSQIDLSPADWDRWRATEGVELLRPELSWEGVDMEPLPSLRGELVMVANELRDPYLFKDQDGSKYLLYVGAGEQAIGIASLE